MGKMLFLNNVINKSTGQVEGFCIVRSVAEKLNKKNEPYLDMVIADREGEMNAKLWNYDVEQHGMYYPESIIKVRGSVSTWKDIDQFTIDRIRKVNENDNYDLSLLIPCAPFDMNWMYGEIMKTADAFNDKELTRLIKHIYKKYEEKILKYPAALKLHHACRGGILYHTLSMMRTGKCICDMYPALDSDLVLGGIMLHDVAKIFELEVGDLGIATGYTQKGQLLGHIPMGVSLVEMEAKAIGISDELATLMEHIVLSHHGTAEHGSPKPPMFPEAEVVSKVDELDANLFEMFAAIDNIGKGEFSERLWALDNRMIYKHGHNMK